MVSLVNDVLVQVGKSGEGNSCPSCRIFHKYMYMLGAAEQTWYTKGKFVR